MEAILTIMVAALLAESVWESGKMIWQQGKLNVDRVGALLLGLLFALGSGLDLCKIVGIVFVYPFIGQVLTGVLLSRGANFIHDLFRATEGLANRN